MKSGLSAGYIRIHQLDAAGRFIQVIPYEMKETDLNNLPVESHDGVDKDAAGGMSRSSGL